MLRMKCRRHVLMFAGVMVLLLGIQTLFLISMLDGVALFKVGKSSELVHTRNDNSDMTQSHARTSSKLTPLSTTRNIPYSVSSWIPTTNVQQTTLNSTKQLMLAKMLRNLLKMTRPADDTYSFNVSLSDRTPMDRPIDDLRPPGCSDVTYNLTSLPTVSVVIPFFNEALSILIRTVHSLLARSPPQLLREIILVDDKSTHAYLGQGFEDYLRFLDNRVVLIRNHKREGLIRSRLKGAERAKSEVLVFLDAHTEHNVGWLEPLLTEINRFSNIVVQPHMAEIGQFDLQYKSFTTQMFRGGFGWDLRYAWFFLPKYLTQTLSSPTDPYPTPVLVGCAIAVRKSYFNSIGAFDEHLEIWGGEHLDLSFRTWMCGGRIVTVACSRVGHLFKTNSYSFEGDRQKVISKNLRRVADIWLDQYKVFFYAATQTHVSLPPLTAHENKTLVERRMLRKKLGCKTFKWYLEHIMPEMKIPPEHAIYHGELENNKTAGCMKVLEDGYIGITYDCYTFRILPENTFTIDRRGRLVFENLCVHMDRDLLLLRLGDCPPVDIRENVGWNLLPGPYLGKLVYTEGSKRWCAMHITNITPVHKFEQMVQMKECEPDTPFLYWKFQYKFTYR
ncbi:polypeptide N-acetylgalactosaminyltransferase 1-like [Gigantopelta aegis]|uniref:polypeptide N-acetylgalactosaminyltransferase 1-like n=1 Tax=Gigantopelta aegis TaxID=1735272 RepID=UPI001B888D13|nr:polypeptide N-acetylgalactosaminyltransferase 1-like [Gigantopelta aegis]